MSFDPRRRLTGIIAGKVIAVVTVSADGRGAK